MVPESLWRSISTWLAAAKARSILGALLVALTALQGCATLPAEVRKEPSAAVPNDGATRLQKLARASIPDAALSGFRLEPLAAYAFETRLVLADRAERALDVQYYILHDDDTGKNLLLALRDAASRGVRVRLLLDDLYTTGEDELFSGLAAFANVEVRLFDPFPAARSSTAMRFLAALADLSRLDHRMHNKLFVADNAFAVAGGRNIADEYFMRSPAVNCVDLDVLAAGPVVAELSSQFDAYWNSSFAYPLDSIVPRTDSPEQMRARFDALTGGVTRPLTDTGVPERLQRYAHTPADIAHGGALSMTEAVAHVYTDPVDKIAGVKLENRDGTVRDEVAHAMRLAREEVFVVSPYFIPGERGLQAMRDLRARGVRLRVLTNSLAATDEPLIHTGYSRYRVPMLEAGVEIYELSPGLSRKRNRLGRFGQSFGGLHAKVSIIDYSRIFVGSMNLDVRSERRNTELGILIDSPDFAEEFVNTMDFRSSVYRLRLAADRHDIEWITGDDETTVLHDDPETTAWLRWKVRLLAPLVPESEL